MNMKRISAVLTATLAIWANPLQADEPPSLEFGLGKEAKQIIQQLQDKGIQNVGVLKFLLTREGEKKFSDSLGPMNLLLARRLETALIVKNSATKPLGIIDNASAVAATIPGASHLSAEGLDKLFAAEYPLVWGRDKVKADGFLVGEGLVDRDLRTVRIGIHLVDAKTRKMQTLTRELVLRIRPEHLVEIGESFNRGAFDGGDTTTKVIELAKLVREKPQTHPIQQGRARFALEVAYDGRVQPINVLDGQAWIAEPREGQTVGIRFTRRDNSTTKYAVVVKVNGENTLFREKLPDLHCLAWISDQKTLNIPQELKGFQISNEQRENFRVASPHESRQREVYYGSDLGTISMTVFGEAPAKRPQLLTYDQQDEQLISRAELPKQKTKPSTFAELQQNLYKGIERSWLIVEGGPKEPSGIRRVVFQRDPVPVMTMTLYYYKKSAQENP
jgi:hypothetical protein